MEITQIKERLSLADVVRYYGLKADKQNRLHCPFHPDKTPSLQLYYKTQTAYCFSSACRTHGKSMDVIDFVMYKENTDKHQAIEKCLQILGESGSPTPASHPGTSPATAGMDNANRSLFLERMFQYFCNAIHNSLPAKEYLQKRELDFRQLEVGYNAGQFHHGTRRDEKLISQCLEVGLLIDKGQKSKTGEKAYTVFGNRCICFALRGREDRITGLYFRSIAPSNSPEGGESRTSRHFYLKNRSGLYPHYPSPDTKRLILTESVIDAATLLQLPDITQQYSILACYGTNGLTEEHRAAIKELTVLEEIIFAFDSDAPGQEATAKYASLFADEYPHLRVSCLVLPGKDVNETAQGHEKGIFLHLLKTRQPCTFSREPDFFLSTEASTEKKNPEPQNTQPSQSPLVGDIGGCLDTTNPYNLHYRGVSADYYVKGGLPASLDTMKVSLQVVGRATGEDYRGRVDLYEYRQVSVHVKAVSERLSLVPQELERELSALCGLLENYRKQRLENKATENTRREVPVAQATMNQCLTFLRDTGLVRRLNELIEQSGVAGEETNRLFLFIIASSYKMPDTLHALIQGSSGSGKTRLLKVITQMMPPEDTIRFTRVTDSSLYNYPENYLSHKLLGFEDIDGLKEDAQYAVRELISNEILTSSTSSKTQEGQIVAQQRVVRGPIASISCTTRGHIYEDNMSRVFLLAVDESPAQTRRIIDYQQQKASGKIESGREKATKEFLQNCVRMLKPYPVVNPYATDLHLPVEAHKIRRLNDLYLSFVKQVTLINQYQRQKDSKGRLITQTQDLRTACRIMFESIVLKVDELDGSLRQFYEQLKGYQRKHPDQETFILRDIRQALRVSKTQLHRYINDLLELEYIQQTSGNAARGYRYKICYWDNVEALRDGIRQNLEKQIEELEKEKECSKAMEH
jgi:DNA primase